MTLIINWPSQSCPLQVKFNFLLKQQWHFKIGLISQTISPREEWMHMHLTWPRLAVSPHLLQMLKIDL